MNTGKRYKWVMLGLLSCAFFFHQADRALFGLLTIPIQDELGLTDLQIGWINTALFCTLALATPVVGILGDRFSRKWIITFSLLFWSLMTACTGFVGGFCGLVFFRSVATGGGEAFYCPSAYALLATHHRETRAVAFSVHQSVCLRQRMLDASTGMGSTSAAYLRMSSTEEAPGAPHSERNMASSFSQ